MTANHGTVELKDDVVVKTVDPGECAIEVARFEAAREVSELVGGFCVPRVLRWDEATGRIELERIRDLFALRDWLGRRNDEREALHRAGWALGHLHERMTLSEVYAGLPLVQAEPGDSESPVVLHGDFSCMNVGWSEGAGGLVVLDWGAVHSGGQTKARGPRHYDAGFFVASLLRVRPWVRSIRSFRWRTGAFITGYAEAAHDLDPAWLRAYVLRFTRGNARRAAAAAAQMPSPVQLAKVALHSSCYCCALGLTRPLAAKPTTYKGVYPA